MAKVKWQGALTDSAIVVAGGGLLQNFLGNMDFVANLVNNIPSVGMGIDLKFLVYGFAALFVAKNYLMK